MSCSGVGYLVSLARSAALKWLKWPSRAARRRFDARMVLDLDPDLPAALADDARGNHICAQDRNPAGGSFGAEDFMQYVHVAESVLQRQRQPAGFENILRARDRAAGLIGLDHDDHKVGIHTLGRVGGGINPHRGQP